MADSAEAALYLGMVALISLSGVMAPGPLLATTICKGYQDPRAGARIALGHALIEVPLIVAIFLGLGAVLQDEAVFIFVGLVGGGVLMYMGAGLLRSRNESILVCDESKGKVVSSGLIMTIANPYWLIWWATAGAALVAGAVVFGWFMLPLFIIVHVSMDLIWYLAVSFSVNRSKDLWAAKWHKWLFVASGGIMLVFGAYFILSATGKLI
ncbi:MAG TPA: LysE family transporter [Methanomassiliicoccales archaeon]|nr:LysE family transporter [Methanomassiliicoccales archaeon]